MHPSLSLQLIISDNILNRASQISSLSDLFQNVTCINVIYKCTICNKIKFVAIEILQYYCMETSMVLMLSSEITYNLVITVSFLFHFPAYVLSTIIQVTTDK